MNIRNELVIALALTTSLFIMAYKGSYPFGILMDWGTRLKSVQVNTNTLGAYELYEDSDGAPHLLIDVKSGVHFWHPQVVIWVEDTLGNFVETLFITESSAKGLFMSGRTAENFKSFDDPKNTVDIVPEQLRLVDALPYWSHRRGKEVLPNFYAPIYIDPEVDAMTGATPQGNFYVSTHVPDSLQTFNIWLEVNVAFDDNAYYSEYDYPGDSLYHGGTGLLGQPSLVYKSTIRITGSTNFHLMELVGHAHHSGQTGELYRDLSSITTASQILDRIVVGWNQP